MKSLEDVHNDLRELEFKKWRYVTEKNVLGGDEKGTQCLGMYVTRPLCSWGI
jgi:hypothetical protein